MLSKIKDSHWYKNNAQLQAYLENEWLNCKPVSVFHLLNSIRVVMVIGYHMQLWSHIYRQCFHNSSGTNNFTQSFNNVLKNHYITLHNDSPPVCLPRPRKRIYNFNRQTENSLPTAKKCLTSFLDKSTKFSHKCLLSQH